MTPKGAWPRSRILLLKQWDRYPCSTERIFCKSMKYDVFIFTRQRKYVMQVRWTFLSYMYKMFLPAYNSAKIIKIHQDFAELRSQMFYHLFYGSQCIAYLHVMNKHQNCFTLLSRRRQTKRDLASRGCVCTSVVCMCICIMYVYVCNNFAGL